MIPIHETDAWGLKEAIVWLCNMSLRTLSVKLDCKQVVDDMSSKLSINSQFVATVDTCKTSLRLLQIR